MLIQHRKPTPNRWRIREDEAPVADAIGSSEAVLAPAMKLPEQNEIISLSAWRSVRARLSGQLDASTAPVGVLLAPGDDPRELLPDLHRIALIAIRFPVFTDGRGYSSARLLRQQLGWSGPLMAVGDVLRDQLLLLDRCGFDTLWLREDQDPEAALSAFQDFSDAYQASAAKVPLFLRRRASIGVAT